MTFLDYSKGLTRLQNCMDISPYSSYDWRFELKASARDVPVLKVYAEEVRPDTRLGVILLDRNGSPVAFSWPYIAFLRTHAILRKSIPEEWKQAQCRLDLWHLEEGPFEVGDWYDRNGYTFL